ncbi:unnamed protein product [Peniophora sp. CBMAI 1063]|nr:unnamed protein product [Peniophora sp. CBMAI 1063]
MQPPREIPGPDVPVEESGEVSLASKLMQRKKPTAPSQESVTQDEVDTAEPATSQDVPAPDFDPLHWHGRFRARSLAERHKGKDPTTWVAPLRGARVLRQHLHAHAYLKSLASLEEKLLEDGENKTTLLNYPALNVPAMINYLESLPADMIPDTYRAHSLRMTLLSQIALTNSPTMAWDSYHLLTLLPHRDGVPIEHLHRLSRLLAKQQPRTRRVFLRILSVLRAIHAAGGIVRRWQWNLLLDAAGEGTRKVHLEDFRTALDILDDMRGGRAPGETFLSAGRAGRVDNLTFSPDDHDDLDHLEDDVLQQGERTQHVDPERQPDHWTHTTLLALAARTRDRRALRRASALHSTTPSTHVTHLVLLSLFAKRQDWSAVRGALRRIGPLTQKAFGTTLWAFASAGRTDVAERMYMVCRARGQERKRLHQELVDSEHMLVTKVVRPNAAVYHALIQAYAYHGDLARCLRTFQDMLVDGTLVSDTGSSTFEPTMTAYRAIFLGFYRHGDASMTPDAVWTLQRLLPIFHRFLDLPPDAKPKRTLMFWILSALWRTSGRDADVVLDAVEKLQARFGGGGRWTGRLERMRVMVEDVAQAGAGEKSGRWEMEGDSGTPQ